MNIDFVTAICEEFCEAMADVVDPEYLSPHECWDPIVKVLGKSFDSAVLARLSSDQIERLRSEFSTWFENEAISVDHVKAGIKGVLSRWPPQVQTLT